MSDPFEDAEAAWRDATEPEPTRPPLEALPEPERPASSWAPIDLLALADVAAIKPTIAGLLYPGGTRHLFSGEPESGKTLAAFALGLEVIRAGGRVLHLDFEMFAQRTRERLLEMGATKTELQAWIHVEPDAPPSLADVDALLALAPTLAIVDAAAGAYAALLLDDNARKDVEQYARLVIDPLARAGVSTITIDHVGKSKEARGRFAIGSERKVGGADVHLSFEPVHHLHRGGNGLVRISVAKDRFGYLPRPHACDIAFASDPDSHAITWTFATAAADAHVDDSDTWQPTWYMEQVSRLLEDAPEPMKRGDIVDVIGRKRKHVLLAIDQLLAGDYVSETPGARGAKLTASLQPFRVPEPFPDVPGNGTDESFPPFPPSKGNGTGNGSVEAAVVPEAFPF